MKYLISILWIFFAANIYAQNNDSYINADKVALGIPSAETGTTAAIAAYINKHLKTDEEKVRTAYVWVAANIRYSTDSIQHIILIEDHDQLVVHSLKRKKGVCENFAAILNDICKKCGLPSFVVEGYTKQNNVMDNTAHAWCTIYTNNAWRLYDPTWDEGVAKSDNIPVNTEYFDVPPEEFIVSHMPFDPMFQLLEHPVDYRDFFKGSFSFSSTPFFNYKDSIAVYAKQNSNDEYEGSLKRIVNNGKPNPMTSTKVAQLKMEIEIINQDKDSVLYNTAVANYNKAVSTFNDFIMYRNNQFKPAKPATDVDASFNEIDKSIKDAQTNILALKSSKAVLAMDTGDMEFALKNLYAKLQEQQAFFKNYIARSH